jgi:hypothetical protein
MRHRAMPCRVEAKNVDRRHMTERSLSRETEAEEEDLSRGRGGGSLHDATFARSALWHALFIQLHTSAQLLAAGQFCTCQVLGVY